MSLKPNRLRGVACMLGGSGMLTLNDAVIKWVGADHPVGQMITIRGLFVMILVLAVVHRPGGRGLRTLRVSSISGMLVWALMLVASTYLFLTGLQYLPLADAAALTFAGPLFVVMLAPLLLGESVGWHRRLGVAVGFGGVLLILKPGAEAFRWAAFLPLSVALIEALRDMIARRMVASETTLAMVFSGALVVTVSGLVTMPWGWPPIDPTTIGLLALAACLQGSAHFFMVEAFRHGEAAFISPFRYASVLWATALGFVLWGDLPEAWIIVGGGLLIGSGLYLLRSKKTG